MKKSQRRMMSNAMFAAVFATVFMAAAYADGTRNSSVDSARHTETAAKGRSAEGNMGMAPGNVSSTADVAGEHDVEAAPVGSNLRKNTTTPALQDLQSNGARVPGGR